jgi:hypothetical protein
MALSDVQTNNKLTVFTQQINREFVRENLFSPYMGEAITAIIRVRNELKKGGEQMNIPLVARLKGVGRSTGKLVDNEEQIDDYGYRLYVDFARNAVKTNKYYQQIDSADSFGEAKPLLSDWGKELQRDETIEALMALPTEAAPVGLASDNGQRINGILFDAATPTELNKWVTDNADRVLFGNRLGNYSTVFATALGNIDATPPPITPTTGDFMSGKNLSLMKYIAKQANPRIRPFKVEDGREYFVAFLDGMAFRDLKEDLRLINKDARPREGRGMDDNPIFQDGDLVYDGVIAREIPDIDPYVAAGGPWNVKLTNVGGVLCHPVFLCGQSALALGWGQMARPTFLKEDDYQFVVGSGVEMCYGIGKVFKKHPKTSGILKQWGVVTGFFAATAL